MWSKEWMKIICKHKTSNKTAKRCKPIFHNRLKFIFDSCETKTKRIGLEMKKADIKDAWPISAHFKRYKIDIALRCCQNYQPSGNSLIMFHKHSFWCVSSYWKRVKYLTTVRSNKKSHCLHALKTALNEFFIYDNKEI